MISLTRQQLALYRFLVAYQKRTGVIPSYVEIMEHMGLRSKSGVNRMINGLKERGYIRVLPKRARGIEIIEPRCPHCGKELR